MYNFLLAMKGGLLNTGWVPRESRHAIKDEVRHSVIK